MPPITPDKIKKQHIPEAVFDAFNKLIDINFANNQSIVKQEEVIKIIVDSGISRKQIFDNNLLDIEIPYREAGWIVKYEKPAYNETHDSCFIFKPDPKSKDKSKWK